MEDPVSPVGLPTTVATAIGVFFACTAALNKWLKNQKGDNEQLAIVTEDRDKWRMLAEKSEEAINQHRSQLNQIIIDQCEMRVQNAVMIEQMGYLRKENGELRSQLAKLLGDRA